MRKPSIEDIKRRKNGLDVWHDIERCATAGYESLDPDALELFRWYGLYEQRPRRGLFMVRIRVPGGAITAVQARAVAQVGRDFAGGRIDVTTRQDLQLHSVPLRQIPEVIRRLHEAGLSTTFACGDTPRNVVACPLAGRLDGEIADAREAVRTWERIHAANRSFANLPRKLKTSLCTCPAQCTIPQIHDVSFVAQARRRGQRRAKLEPGYALLVGGGLGTRFLPALPLDVWLPEHRLGEVAEALTTLYATQAPRQSRSHARLRYLVRDWSPQGFRDRLGKLLGSELDRAEPVPLADTTFREHLGPGHQRERTRQYLSLVTTAGRSSPEDLFVAATVAERWGSGLLLLTTMQNLIVPDIAAERLEEATDRLALAPTARVRSSDHRAGTVACTGAEYCELALAETKDLAASVVDALEKDGVSSPVPLNVSVSGCPNDCAHAQIADIGLMGAQARGSDAEADVFDLLIGGRLGQGARAGRLLRAKVPADQVPGEVTSIVRAFAAGRRGSESFAVFAERYVDQAAGEYQI